MAEKKTEEKEVGEKAVKAPGKRYFKVVDKKNFVGFMHPGTKKFVTANKERLFEILETDKKALAIAEAASDLTNVTSLIEK